MKRICVLSGQNIFKEHSIITLPEMSVSPEDPPLPWPVSWSNGAESMSLHNDNITEASVLSH